MPDNLNDIVSDLKNFLHNKEENLKGALTSDITTIKLFYQQIDELESSAKEIEVNFANNENILFNFNKRVQEIRSEIEGLEL